MECYSLQDSSSAFLFKIKLETTKTYETSNPYGTFYGLIDHGGTQNKISALILEFASGTQLARSFSVSHVTVPHYRHHDLN